MEFDGRKRVVIENVGPEVDSGRFPVKRVIGDKVRVLADIFADGHDALSARILYRKEGEGDWKEAPMKHRQNDSWEGEWVAEEVGSYRYTVEGWIDHFKTWQQDLRKKIETRQPTRTDLLAGIRYIEEASKRAADGDREKLLKIAEALRKEEDQDEALALSLDETLSELMTLYPDKTFAVSYDKELVVVVDRKKALFSAWYEFFPRSCSPEPRRHGTFKDCEGICEEIADMGFDVLYLPPIHPIGKANRKGKDNALKVHPGDVGSPWAIGSEAGGHKAVHPQLGTLGDFERFVEKAKAHGLEIALDLAFQCSPDHPYLKDHPEWFRWRPDGTIQYAENPPKKYEDIIPFNFESDAWETLWEELRSIVLFWIGKGIRIFRVDNPHTKPFAFWEWLIREVRKDYPDVIFCCEAFTRPKVMYRLAKVGFTQSYTYFTWRNTKKELTDYLTELARTHIKEYFRPNFWPNTPDILPEYLQFGGRPAFMIRLVLAATLVSSYGIYGPAFELAVTEAILGKEEYLHSEKYQLKHWNRETVGTLRNFVAKMNSIRKENPALQTPWNLRFHGVDNDTLLFYTKITDDLSNILLVVVNLDPFHTQSGWVRVPLKKLGIDPAQPYLVHDLLSDDKSIWQGESNFVELNPQMFPANIFRVRKKMKRENDFDYFM